MKIGVVVGRAGRSFLRLLRCGLIGWPPAADVLCAALRTRFSALPVLGDAASGRTDQPGEKLIFVSSP
jgi:hypothetical protein